jgi:hypothetical protein
VDSKIIIDNIDKKVEVYNDNDKKRDEIMEEIRLFP